MRSWAWSIAVLALLASLLGCASNSNFYSARPLGQGNSQAFVAVSTIDTERPEDTLLAAVIRPDFTIFEVGASAGVTDKLDVGVKYSFPTAGFIEARYALLGADRREGFFFAPGLRAGYTAFPQSADQEEENSRVELAVPLFLSYFPLEWLGVSLIPTCSFRYFTAAEGYSENLLGGNVNVRIGKKVGGLVEGAFHQNFKWKWLETQIGAGIYFEIHDLF
jgi:hypothetical protein